MNKEDIIKGWNGAATRRTLQKGGDDAEGGHYKKD